MNHHCSGKGKAKLTLKFGAAFHTPDTVVYYDLPIVSGVSTVQNLLDAANVYGSPPPPYTYTGCGPTAFLTSIDGVTNNQNDNNYYWLYKVNGQFAQVGFGVYILSDGDRVTWIYKEYIPGEHE